MPKKNILLSPHQMCRICLNDGRIETEEFIDVMGPNEPHLQQHVKEYFKVDITGVDGKSTKICENCVEFIDIWQGHILKAQGNQRIVDFLSEKGYILDEITSRAVRRPWPGPKKKRKTISKRSKKRKESSLIPEHEIPSTSISNDMIQSPLEYMQPSTSTSNHMFQSPLEYMRPSTSTSNHMFQSLLEEYMQPSTSASNDMIQSPLEYMQPSTSTSNYMIQSPLEYMQPSTSAYVYQSTSKDTQYFSDFPSMTNSNKIIPCTSTSTEIIPFASTSAEVIPFASTSAEVVPLASTSAEVIPFASSSNKIIPITSTSTEIIPFASTSAEVIPFPSTSTEMVPSYTTNEVSTAEDNPVWYSNENGITDPESEVFDRFKSVKAESVVCIFCTYQHEELSVTAYKHLLFCRKHSKPYACLMENCHSVFPSKAVFISHYRTHLNLNSSTFLCHKCFSVLTRTRNTSSSHTHQNISDLFKCCSLTFRTMTELVLHKLVNHCAIIVTSNNRSRTLQKQNLNINKTELENIKVGLNVPGTVPPFNQIIKDNGSLKCYCCPKYFTNIKKFIDHTKIKHKNLITLKDQGIKLCPLCDHSYLNEQYSEHIENCTNTLKVGDKSLNHYGCIYCTVIFTNVSPREFRNHVLYCKSFKLVIVGNKLHHKCINCTFTSTDDNLCLEHANSNCIFLQMKMRYAMGPNEKLQVEREMEYFMHNTEQQVDENTNNVELLSSNTVCNAARQKLLKFHKYFCNKCKNLFFNNEIFLKHLTETGAYCRLQTLVYCQKCLTEFNTWKEYEGHLPSTPGASPILPIKQELYVENNDEYDDLSMEVVSFNPNYCDVKVEMNNETFYQKQEPYDETSDMQEQEQEVSNNDLNNCYSNPEMEYDNEVNEMYMVCEVENKPDFSQLLENLE